MKPTTVNRFESRLKRVADHLAAHLDEPLSLDRLAEVAAMSPFHFHRLWTAMVGETVAASVRRLRLQHAAHQLRASAAPVTDIALSAGFASAQAFARAFRAACGSTPSEYRAAPSEWAPWSLAGSSAASSVIEVRLVHIEPLSIVAMRRTGAYTDSDLAEDFQVPWAWAEREGRLEGLRGIYGVPWNEPELAEVPIFFAGLDLGACPPPPAPLEVMVLDGGDYAVTRVTGSYVGIDDACAALYRDWLPASGREPADAPLFHHYIDDPEATPEHALRTDIYLPLQPL
ncbi:AraC family transcriptional regulator [Luteibacter jiangsuensis]|uniref:AraC family transcriptional regulator n=1 Tax=Luteibacter jiangsuensis TaxID=637577 RepID=A0ABX0Q936_9GAMM|nr:AraC family transcriptional regulator [Luteibacter jiangsuensis]NID06167.1 AraC family transcriptional regulator [Luteibacter jiangsuensis]